jgi:ubiquitin-protein ligase
MHQSPRTRRLHNDLAALERLRAESTVFRFTATGDPPQMYHLLFQGKGLCRDRGQVKFLDHHRVEIKLGASYPRSMPEIRWVTPIYHPNISEIGMVCLGGYGTHWVPSIQLDELCVMLWDMLRYHNYDIRSPYNRESALWTAGQTNFRFPTDARPLRDLRASQGRAPSASEKAMGESVPTGGGSHRTRPASSRPSSDKNPVGRVLQFIERYGRKLGELAPAGGQENEPRGPSRRQTEVDRARQLIERVGQFANHGVPTPARPGPAVESPRPSLEPAERPCTSAPAPPVDQASQPVDEPAEMLILEASADDGRLPFEPPGSEAEVFFID